MNSNEIFINRCLQLAKLGKGNVSPNPMVGCVIVYEGKIIGEGYHQQYGKAHAEVNAINSVKDKSLLQKSSIYVSLEPCAHFGKTPPCANLIVHHKIPNVIIACTDSFSEVNGKGIKILRDAGINVTLNVLEQKAVELNKRFFTFHHEKRPYIFLKWAESSDKYIAKTQNGKPSQTSISNELSKQHSHYLRSKEDAILIGKNTLITDNPSLTTRLVKGHSPIRVVLDRKLETLNNTFNIYSDNQKTIVFNHLKNESSEHLKLIKVSGEDEISFILKKLYELNIQSLIIEGGTKILQSFINKNLWDEAYVYKANKKINEGVKSPIIIQNPIKSVSLDDNILEVYRNER